MKASPCLAALLLLVSMASSPADEPPGLQRTQITVNVLGSVNQPSRITLPNGATILDALASAGNASPGGNLSRVKIIHRSAAAKPDTVEVNVKKILEGASGNAALRDGDTINVPKSLYVMP